VTTEPSYIHGTSPEEQRRLSLMNDVLLNPPSLREMHLRGDERIVDFGSGLGQFTRAMARAVPRGHVVGLERNTTQLESAKHLASTDGESHLVDFRSGNVLDGGLADDEWGTFDLAHARFVLEHVPDPLAVLRNMVRAVRPGGRVVVADDDHDLIRLWPEPPGFTDLWRAYMRTYDRNGTDPFVGRRLVSLMHQAGATPVRNTLIFFGGCSGMESFQVIASNMLGVVLTAEEMILRHDLLDAATFRIAVDSFREWAQRPDAALWYAMSWAEGLARK
jgi:SAM-dependent methyltransferase